MVAGTKTLSIVSSASSFDGHIHSNTRRNVQRLTRDINLSPEGVSRNERY
jgi:hypothetical protein